MFLDPHSPAFWHREMMEGRYDSFIYEALDECGRIEAATIWDVGAHIGYHSLAFANLVGSSGQVVAFEPNPVNVDRFQRHLEKNSQLANRIQLMTFALSNVDGEASFTFSPEVDDGRSSGSHLNGVCAPEGPTAYQGFGHATVTTFKADTLLRNRCVPAPSIIKIDVEGAEFLVLQGSLEMLSATEPILFIEVHHIVSMFYIQEYLTKLGYTIHILDEGHSMPYRCFVIAKPGRI